MIGPVVFVVGGALIGFAFGGAPGAFAGALIGVGLVAAMVASMSAWVYQIGVQLDPEEAFAAAPRPWGFSALSDRVYGRLRR